MANSFSIKETVVNIGDTVAVNYTFNEGGKEKKQAFEGVVVAVRGRGDNKMFTVRKMTRSKIGVERIIPVISPFVESVKITKKGSVRRAKVSFIRKKSEREIRERVFS